MRRRRQVLYILPNLFTFSSVFCGLLAIHWSTQPSDPNGFVRAALAILFAAVFDMLDGRVARLTHTESEIGVQLDSLADVISFGVAPAFLLYNWGLGEMMLGSLDLGFVLCFVYAAAGAYRLARFNALAYAAARDGDEQSASDSFVGLPIPAAAGMIAAMVFAHHQTDVALFQKRALLLVLVPTLAWLMVSNVSFRSFKHPRFTCRSIIAVAAALGLVVLVALRTAPAVVLALVLAGYVMVGLAEHVLRLPGRVAHRRSVRRARRAERAALEAELLDEESEFPCDFDTEPDDDDEPRA